VSAAKTTVDWLRFRTQAQPLEVLEALRPLYGDLGSHLRLKPLQRGALGFQQAAQVLIGDMSIGRLDYGGESQRGWVRADMPGKACEWVRDWDALEEVEALPSTELRRVDLALTTWRGEVGHERVVAAHAAGRFRCGGRPPVLFQRISSDPRAGRTCEIGKREKADKFLRCYEKGYQLAARFPEGELTSIDGCPVEDIYRCEVELKAENRPITFDVVPQRDSYFAGSYPFLADLLPGVEADILMRRPERQPQSDLRVALANARRQFGATFRTALAAFHGDEGALLRQIVGKDHNRDLVAAGVLQVEHDWAWEER
jgi:DNA relaxase NicK